MSQQIPLIASTIISRRTVYSLAFVAVTTSVACWTPPPPQDDESGARAISRHGSVGDWWRWTSSWRSLGRAMTGLWIGHPDARPVDRGSGAGFPGTHFGSSTASASLFALVYLPTDSGFALSSCQDLLIRRRHLKLIPPGSKINLIRAELGKGGFPN